MGEVHANTKRYWIGLGVVLVVTFGILGFFGGEVYRKAPPIPDRVVSEDGRILMTKEEILSGQQVWQSIGGQQVGSIWGHGAYQAPDWSADWLHREAVALLAIRSMQEYGSSRKRSSLHHERASRSTCEEKCGPTGSTARREH